MRQSSDKKRSKLNIIACITVAMLAEAVFVLWPLGIVLADVALSADLLEEIGHPDVRK